MKILHQQILEILADGNFHSGEKLAKTLGITRTAIWKIIQKLTQYGIIIYSIKGKGYQIPNGLNLLNEHLIIKNLDTEAKEIISAFHLFKSIDSTNQFLLEQIKKKMPEVITCVAEHQTKGRGRRDRNWYSPFGKNLYLSLYWKFSKDPAEISGLSLACGVAIVGVLNKYGIDKNLGLKWPNDILYNQKKLAGILIEILAESNDVTHVVIGLGLNMDMPNNHLIDQPWIDLKTILGKAPERNQFAALIINALVSMLWDFQKNGLSSFIDQWQHLDIARNQEVILQTISQENIRGVASGITERGELILLDETQQLRRFLSGEVSLRLYEAQ